MAPKSSSQRHYRCRFCGLVLPAWLPVAQRLDSAMLLGHLGRHQEQAQPYHRRMETECIDTVLGELYTRVEGV
jgi:hypothetical protein